MAQFPAPARGGPVNSNQPSNPPNVMTSPAGGETQPQTKHRKSNEKCKNTNEPGANNGAGQTVANNVSSQKARGNAPKAQAVQKLPRPKQKPANAVKQRLPVPARALPKFLRLPPEVQKRIFEIAASDPSWDNQHVKGWVRISRKVREWVEPCIYHSIELPCHDEESKVTDRNRKKLELLEGAFQLQPKKFAKNVKRIFTLSRPELGENSIELKLLSTCDNLEVLECWSTPRKALTDILMTKHWPKLKNLCLNIDLLPKDENVFRFPLFQHLSHLDFKSEEALPSWKSFESLKCLTHVRINTMRKLTTRKETTTVVDHVCSIAREVRNHLPPKLQHLVILIPIDILYYMCIESQKHKVEERWKMVESIRIGDFDERIMLGCEGDTYHWFDQGGPCNDEPDEDGDDEDGDDEDNMEDFGEHYLHTTPIITCPTQPRNDPFDPQGWKEVEEKNECGKRKRIEKYRIFVKTGEDDNDDDGGDNDGDSNDDEDGDDDNDSSEK